VTGLFEHLSLRAAGQTGTAGGVTLTLRQRARFEPAPQGWASDDAGEGVEDVVATAPPSPTAVTGPNVVAVPKPLPQPAPPVNHDIHAAQLNESELHITSGEQEGTREPPHGRGRDHPEGDLEPEHPSAPMAAAPPDDRQRVGHKSPRPPNTVEIGAPGSRPPVRAGAVEEANGEIARDQDRPSPPVAATGPHSLGSPSAPTALIVPSGPPTTGDFEPLEEPGGPSTPLDRTERLSPQSVPKTRHRTPSGPSADPFSQPQSDVQEAAVNLSIGQITVEFLPPPASAPAGGPASPGRTRGFDAYARARRGLPR